MVLQGCGLDVEVAKISNINLSKKIFLHLIKMVWSWMHFSRCTHFIWRALTRVCIGARASSLVRLMPMVSIIIELKNILSWEGPIWIIDSNSWLHTAPRYYYY